MNKKDGLKVQVKMNKYELVELLKCNGYAAEIEEGVPIVNLSGISQKELKKELKNINELKRDYEGSFGWKVRMNNESK